MDRNNLINRLVARTLASKDKGKANCVPCFGGSLRTTQTERTGQAPAKK